jgi:hypothetical protein
LYQSPPQKASSKKTPPRKTDAQLSLFGEDEADSDEPPPKSDESADE